MLTSLSIQNIVLIKNLNIFFGHKLSVFTGETGAGKSILLNALSIALGGKCSQSVIRNGESFASVTAVFRIDIIDNLIELLDEHSIPYDRKDCELIFRRVISSDGKNRSYINDIPVSVSVLKNIGELLVEIHGQFDNQGLMNPVNHIKILDEFGDLVPDTKHCELLFNNWKNLEKQRKNLEISIQKAKDNEEYIKYNLDELTKLNPIPGEESDLADKRKKFIENKKLSSALQSAIDSLDNKGTNVSSLLRNCILSLNTINSSDIIKNIISDLEIALDKIDTVAYGLEKFASDNFSDIDIDTIEARLFKIHELSRKHNCSPDNLHEVLTKFATLISNIENNDDVLVQIKLSEEKAKQEYYKFANELHNKRVNFASKLSDKVCSQLPALKLEKANFEVIVDKVDDNKCSGNGVDSVEFMISTNTGMQSGLINKIASGGELARFVLAIKVALSSANLVSTFIFDELDTGISGATATAVGEKLLKLSENIQVMLVTHSAQVASFGTHHFKITKESILEEDGKESIETKITQLDLDGRIQEIARIISDDKISDTAIDQAKHLLNKNI